MLVSFLTFTILFSMLYAFHLFTESSCDNFFFFLVISAENGLPFASCLAYAVKWFQMQTFLRLPITMASQIRGLDAPPLQQLGALSAPPRALPASHSPLCLLLRLPCPFLDPKGDLPLFPTHTPLSFSESFYSPEILSTLVASLIIAM